MIYGRELARRLERPGDAAAKTARVRLWEMENGSNFKNWAAHPGGAAGGEVQQGRAGGVSIGRDKLHQSCGTPTARSRSSTSRSPTSAFRWRSPTTTRHWCPATGAGHAEDVGAAADNKLIAANDTNPLPAVERLKVVEAAFVAADAQGESDRRPAFNDLNAKNADGPEAVARRRRRGGGQARRRHPGRRRKLVTDQTAALTAAKAATPVAKAEVDKPDRAGPDAQDDGRRESRDGGRVHQSRRRGASRRRQNADQPDARRNRRRRRPTC